MGTGSCKPQNYGAFKTEADLSAKQFYAVKVGSAADQCALSGANEKAIGILQNKPGSGQIADVALPGGGALAIVSESVTVGQYLTSTASGKLEVADAASEHVIAIADEAGDANDVIAVTVVLFETYASDAS